MHTAVVDTPAKHRYAEGEMSTSEAVLIASPESLQAGASSRDEVEEPPIDAVVPNGRQRSFESILVRHGPTLSVDRVLLQSGVRNQLR